MTTEEKQHIMNKICTSIEQSQKLIELGIDVNTADMYWLNRHIDLTETKYELFVVDRSNEYVDFFNSYAVAVDNNEIIPAWSLAALVELLPPFIRQRKFGRDISYWLHMTKRTIRYEYYDESYDGYDYLLRATDDNDCLLDAVYSAIVKLKEQKIL